MRCSAASGGARPRVCSSAIVVLARIRLPHRAVVQLHCLSDERFITTLPAAKRAEWRSLVASVRHQARAIYCRQPTAHAPRTRAHKQGGSCEKPKAQFVVRSRSPPAITGHWPLTGQRLTERARSLYSLPLPLLSIRPSFNPQSPVSGGRSHHLSEPLPSGPAPTDLPQGPVQ